MSRSGYSDGCVHVCPTRDIVCGSRPEYWCATCPLKREPMTDDQILEIARQWSNSSYVQHDGRFILDFARAIIEACSRKAP